MDFLEHFKNISNTAHCEFMPENINSDQSNDINIELLDSPFTAEEISKTISSLNRYKKL
jgi:hypothetical protein